MVSADAAFRVAGAIDIRTSQERWLITTLVRIMMNLDPTRSIESADAAYAAADTIIVRRQKARGSQQMVHAVVAAGDTTGLTTIGATIG